MSFVNFKGGTALDSQCDTVRLNFFMLRTFMQNSTKEDFGWNMNRKNIFVVRYLDKSGQYPEVEWCTTESNYSFDPGRNVLCSVVRLQDEDRTYNSSEVAWAYPSEIKLWAALALSIPADQGWITFVPSSRPLILDESLIDDALAFESIRGIGSALLTDECIRSVFRDESDICKTYNFHSGNVDPKELNRILNGIDLKDQVLIRGLSCFLKAQYLGKNRLTLEEATLMLFISLEAAFSIIRRENVFESYEQVFNHFLNDPNTDGESIVHFFRECRKLRNIISHPDSREGAYGIPPLMADDFCDIYNILSELYRFLIAGIPWDQG